MAAPVAPQFASRGKRQLFNQNNNSYGHVPTAPLPEDLSLSQAFQTHHDRRAAKTGTKRGWSAPMRAPSGERAPSQAPLEEPPSLSQILAGSQSQSSLPSTAKRRKRELEFKTPMKMNKPRDILDLLSQNSQFTDRQTSHPAVDNTQRGEVIGRNQAEAAKIGQSRATVTPHSRASVTPYNRASVTPHQNPRSAVVRPTPSLSGRDDPRFLGAVDALRGRKRSALPGEFDSSQRSLSFDASQSGDASPELFAREQSPERRVRPLVLPGPTPMGTRVNRELRSVEEIPAKYRSIFKFPYFNLVQSKVFDDVFDSSRSVILCAPTGSGKTAVFELALIRLLHDLEASGTPLQFKAVYMAPMKALCSERFEDWRVKFEPLGVRCLELTGDTETEEWTDLYNINIIITTPEKWDIMTRKWRDNRSLINKLQLFMVDEIHNLNDESRGATMEVVISRMKTVDAACRRQDGSRGIRFVAVSATVPNVEDLAEWLGRDNQKAAFYNLDDSYRPVKLQKVVLGFPCTDGQKGFKFDYSLNYKVSAVVKNYSNQKPTLVFVSTRKGTQQAATVLAKDAKFVLDAQHKDRLRKSTQLVKEAKLRELLLMGIGYHHAGLDKQDRKLVEEVFINGDLPVLFATSTLAMGVNLPAHLVIVKCTQYYNMGVYTEYPESSILQMIGRAGRPQFDTSATAVLMTRYETKSKYEKLLNGMEVIESSLHRHLIEHVNAEVVLRTISDVNVALEWIRCTFLYIRCMKNPKHYGLPIGYSRKQVEDYLQTLCRESVLKLHSARLIDMNDNQVEIKPTELGRHMARFCITYDTMTAFMNVKGGESLSTLIEIISSCDQFDITLRTLEKRVLNNLNECKNQPTIRFPMKGKKIKSADMKINVLIQATLGCLKVDDFSLTQDAARVFRVGVRLARCLVEIFWAKNQFETLLNAVLLAKCFYARLWENSKYIVRQLEGIGPIMSNTLVSAGLTSFQKFEETNPRDIELHAGKRPPFGDNIRSLVIGLPKYRLDLAQVGRSTAQSCELEVTVSLSNRDSVMMFRTAGKEHRCCLLVGDSDNNIICQARIKDEYLLHNDWSRKVTVRRGDQDDTLHVYYISLDWVGIDISTSFSPQYSAPRPRPINPVKPMPAVDKRPINDRNMQVDPSTGRVPCNHRCANKRLCAHDCCKNGIKPARPAVKKLEKPEKKSKISMVQEFIQRRMTPQVEQMDDLDELEPAHAAPLFEKFGYQPAPKLSRQPRQPSVFDNPFDDDKNLSTDSVTEFGESKNLSTVSVDEGFAMNEYTDPDRMWEYEEKELSSEPVKNNSSRNVNSSNVKTWNSKKACPQPANTYDSATSVTKTRGNLNSSIVYGDFDCCLDDSPPMDYGGNSPENSDDQGWKGPEILDESSDTLPDLVWTGATDRGEARAEVEWSDGEVEQFNPPVDQHDGHDPYSDFMELEDDVTLGDDDVIVGVDDVDMDYCTMGDDIPVMERRPRELRDTSAAAAAPLNESGYSSYSDPGMPLDSDQGMPLDRIPAEFDDFADSSPTDELLSKVQLPQEASCDDLQNDSLDDLDIPDDDLAQAFEEDIVNAPAWKTSTPKSKSLKPAERRFSFKKTDEPASSVSYRGEENAAGTSNDNSSGRPKPIKFSSARKLFTPSNSKLGDSFLPEAENTRIPKMNQVWQTERSGESKSVANGMKNWRAFSNTSKTSENSAASLKRPALLGAPVPQKKKVSFNEKLDYEPVKTSDFRSARSLMARSYGETETNDRALWQPPSEFQSQNNDEQESGWRVNESHSKPAKPPNATAYGNNSVSNRFSKLDQNDENEDLENRSPVMSVNARKFPSKQVPKTNPLPRLTAGNQLVTKNGVLADNNNRKSKSAISGHNSAQKCGMQKNLVQSTIPAKYFTPRSQAKLDEQFDEIEMDSSDYRLSETMEFMPETGYKQPDHPSTAFTADSSKISNALNKNHTVSRTVNSSTSRPITHRLNASQLPKPIRASKQNQTDLAQRISFAKPQENQSLEPKIEAITVPRPDYFLYGAGPTAKWLRNVMLSSGKLVSFEKLFEWEDCSELEAELLDRRRAAVDYSLEFEAMIGTQISEAGEPSTEPIPVNAIDANPCTDYKDGLQKGTERLEYSGRKTPPVKSFENVMKERLSIRDPPKTESPPRQVAYSMSKPHSAIDSAQRNSNSIDANSRTSKPAVAIDGLDDRQAPKFVEEKPPLPVETVEAPGLPGRSVMELADDVEQLRSSVESIHVHETETVKSVDPYQPSDTEGSSMRKGQGDSEDEKSRKKSPSEDGCYVMKSAAVVGQSGAEDVSTVEPRVRASPTQLMYETDAVPSSDKTVVVRSFTEQMSSVESLRCMGNSVSTTVERNYADDVIPTCGEVRNREKAVVSHSFYVRKSTSSTLTTPADFGIPTLSKPQPSTPPNTTPHHITDDVTMAGSDVTDQNDVSRTDVSMVSETTCASQSSEVCSEDPVPLEERMAE